MTFYHQIILMLLGAAITAVLGVLVWLFKRWISRSGESEAIQTVKGKLEAMGLLKEHGLPHAGLERSIHKDLARVTADSKGIDPVEAKRVAEALKRLSEQAKLKELTITDEQLKSIQELIEVLFNRLLDAEISGIGLLEWTAELDPHDARVPLLILERDVSLLKTLTAMADMDIPAHETSERELSKYVSQINIEKLEGAIAELAQMCGIPAHMIESVREDLRYVQQSLHGMNLPHATKIIDPESS